MRKIVFGLVAGVVTLILLIMNLGTAQVAHTPLVLVVKDRNQNVLGPVVGLDRDSGRPIVAYDGDVVGGGRRTFFFNG